jgi:hypothetical protein
VLVPPLPLIAAEPPKLELPPFGVSLFPEPLEQLAANSNQPATTITLACVRIPVVCENLAVHASPISRSHGVDWH